MAVVPVARMLLEMGGPPAPAVSVLSDDPGPATCCKGCNSEEEVRLAVEEAHARGLAAGIERGHSDRIRSEDEIEAGLRAEQEAHLAVLSSEVLAKIEAGLVHVRQEISRSVARLLATFFQDKIKEEAIDVLAAELGGMLAEKVGSRVLIRGPTVWIDTLRGMPSIDGSGSTLELLPSDASDVHITVDGTILETTVGSWIAGIENAL